MNTMHEPPGTRHAQEGAQAAAILLDLGYSLVPVAGKNPYEMGWYEKPYPVFVLQERLARGDNLGMLFGQELADGTFLVALDADLTIPALAAAVRAKMGDVSARIGRRPKFLIPIRVKPEDSFSRDYHFYDSQEVGAARQSIQILGRASKAPHRPKQAVAYGDHPDTGKPYFWEPDSQGRSIYQMRPTDWPLVPNLEALMLDISATMATLGWNCRKRGAATESGDEFGDEITAEMIDDAQRLFEQGLDDVSTRGAGANRGTSVYTLGLQVGMLIKRGLLDLDQCKRAVDAAMPDDAGHAAYEFENGVNNSKGFRQQKIHEKRNPDWAGAAKAQGFDFEEVLKGAQANEGGFKAEEKADAKEIYRRPLVVAVCDILYDAMRMRDAEARTKAEGVAWGFMSSLLAAGMATTPELVDEWRLRAERLNKINATRYIADAQSVLDGVSALQPSEAAWAECAADLLFEKRVSSPGAAIRTAQLAHRAGPTPKTSDAWALEIMASQSSDWDREGEDICNDRSSNLGHFMAYKLGVWPFFDEFTRRITFRRLRPFGSMNCEPNDKELAVWNGRTSKAVAAIYSKATNARALWGLDHYAPKKSDVEIWVSDYASLRSFNSVVDRLASWVAWDGQGRVSDWFGRYMGYRPVDAAYGYVCKAGAHWIANWVARMMRPGHKFDEILAAIGLEGERKTTLFETLADAVMPGSYLGGQKFQFDSSSGVNRVAEMTAGKLLVELAELKRLIRMDPEAFKALISGTVDSGRATYSPDSFDQKRQFSFVGTANVTPRGCSPNDITTELLALPPERRDARKREIMKTVDAGFLVDGTGSRRFLPALVLKHKMDLGALQGEAEQLIAEAKEIALAADFVLHMDDDLEAMRAPAAQQFDETDGLEDVLREALEPVDGVADFKIPAEDLRRLLGLPLLTKRAALKAAAAKAGLSSKHTEYGTVYYRGDWGRAERLGLMGGAGVMRATPPPGAGFSGV